jgi:hypothetical protein
MQNTQLFGFRTLFPSRMLMGHIVQCGKMPDSVECFRGLDNYSRWCVYMGGLAFTSYEDLGEHVCTELMSICIMWFSLGCPDNWQKR